MVAPDPVASRANQGSRGLERELVQKGRTVWIDSNAFTNAVRAVRVDLPHIPMDLRIVGRQFLDFAAVEQDSDAGVQAASTHRMPPARSRPRS